ncbi:MAG: hypothetical protein IKQ09_05460 [Bacteroidales bacterium]|nr:hypothetical protein [Bacteroidales bacterium]
MTVRNSGAQESYLKSIDEFSNKADIRKYMLYLYATEDCKTKIRYYVETLANGKRIYLERPTALNKGCDFRIYVEDLLVYNNGNDKCPSHNDVFRDLALKKDSLSDKDYFTLLSAIDDIYNVLPYQVAEEKIKKLPNPQGWPYETLLKLIRWLFIEQDITYWAQMGREMLMNGIKGV